MTDSESETEIKTNAVSLEEAEIIVNRLCSYFFVPKIKVIKEKLPTGVQARFSVVNYTIEIGEETTAEDVCHEFSHYLFTLLKETEKAEERLADAIAKGLILVLAESKS
jgi:hypothetical protein